MTRTTIAFLRPVLLLAAMALGHPRSLAQAPLVRVFDANTSFLPSAPFVLEAGNGDLLTIVRCEGNERRYRTVRMDANGSVLAANDVAAVNSTNLSLQNALELPNRTLALVGSYNNKMSLVLLDTNGSVINGHSYPNFTQPMARTVAVEGTDVLVLSGQFIRNGVLVPYVVRTALDGTLIAAEEHDGDGWDATFEHSVQASDGGVIMIGASGDSVGGAYTYEKNILISRSDSSGATLWGHRLLCAGATNRAVGLAELPSGNIVIAGRHTPIGGVQSPFLLLLDPAGDPLWAQYYNTGDVNVQDMTLTADHRIVLSGTSSSTSKVMVLDTTGTVLDLYAMSENAYAHCASTADGGLVLSVMGQFPLNQATGLARLDPGLSWPCTTTPLTVAGPPIPLTVQSMGIDSVFALAVSPQDFSSNLVNIPEPLNPHDLCITTGMEAQEVMDTPTVYPNPTAGAVTIAVADIRAVDLLDVTGKVVRSFVVPTGTRCTILDLTAVAPGTYALRVMDGTGWHVERLIKD